MYLLVAENLERGGIEDGREHRNQESHRPRTVWALQKKTVEIVEPHFVAHLDRDSCGQRSAYYLPGILHIHQMFNLL